MKVIEHKHVIPIIRNTLNALDARLVDHGYRVAFLMEQTLRHAGLFEGKELRDIVMTCFLHDIGAYKTEEIEQLIQFETWDIYQHSVYGYLF
ncbi:MAG: HD domain-containing protein [[Clostridium] innocuum]